jgi:hypothetical protein
MAALVLRWKPAERDVHQLGVWLGDAGDIIVAKVVPLQQHWLLLPK